MEGIIRVIVATTLSQFTQVHICLQTELEIEPRFPMFGGWRTSFTIGYGLPLQDFLFESEGKRFLNISFGCPIDEVVVDNLLVKASNLTQVLCI